MEKPKNKIVELVLCITLGWAGGHKFYNKNFSGLLKSARMWGARGLIINNKTNKLEKISQLCGYNDYSAFYKNYKDFFGVSPKDDLMFYRKHKTFARVE